MPRAVFRLKDGPLNIIYPAECLFSKMVQNNPRLSVEFMGVAVFFFLIFFFKSRFKCGSENLFIMALVLHGMKKVFTSPVQP